MVSASPSNATACLALSALATLATNDRALALYMHTADQSSVYATRAISCAPREANYVLDGILENDTILDSRVHDRHRRLHRALVGLCGFLGIDFMPRLKDLYD